MPRIAWFYHSDLLRIDDLPSEWCPYHTHFYCELCGEVWAKRIHLDRQAVYCFRPMKCPHCASHPEFLGMRGSLLNGYETQAGYLPIEILVLDFLSNSSEINNVN
jgi:hypothetical protein